MRRAGRIIYNLATAVSVLLCLASVVLWMRSYCAVSKSVGALAAIRGL